MGQTLSDHIQVFFDTLLIFCYSAFIYWLSSHPKLPAPIWFSWQDKLYHGGAYFILGILTWRFFRHWIINGRIQLLATLLFCTVYGFSDEWHQAFIPGRTSSVADWFADTLGAVVATGIIAIMNKRSISLNTKH